MAAWGFAGCLPPYFDEDVREAWRRAGGVTPITPSGHGEKEVKRLVNNVVKWAVVSPRLVEGGSLDNNELDPSYLSVEDWNYLGDKVIKGETYTAVRMADGTEAQIEDLRSFREEPEGEKPLPHPAARDPQLEAAVGDARNP